MAMIIDGEKRIPFLRGMLTHYLIEHGFSFQEAYQLADRVRTALQKRNEVSAKRMVKLVQSHVQELFGDRAIGNGVFWEPGPRQVLVEDAQGRRPFSRGRLSRSLTISGLDDMRAYGIAERILADFVQQGRTIVHRDDIQIVALEVLKNEVSEEVAERYYVWHEFRNSEHPRPLIVLIGGASGVGKTSVGVALANLLRISRVASTDEIRQVMRLMIAPDLIPALHDSSYAAWENISGSIPDTVDPVIHAYREQAMRVCVGIRATIERAVEESASLILDGVHLLPDLIDVRPYRKKALFIWANLYLSDEKLYTERFEYRGKLASRRSSHRYLKYLDQILKIQQHILEAGEAGQVLAVENTDFDETVQSISLQIMDTLRKEGKSRPNRTE